MAWPAVCTTLHPWPTAWHRAISSGLSHSRARAWQARIAAFAWGYPIYELTALVCALGPDRCRAAVDTRAQIYLDRLLYWQDHWRDWSGSWAAFLCR